MPRLVNAKEFELGELVDQSVLEVIGCTESDNERAIDMLLIRISDCGVWHRMYLDAGIGFWETLPEEEAFYDYSDSRRVNLGDRWRLIGERIIAASCIGKAPEQLGLSEFYITFEKGVLKFYYANPKDMDSDTLLDFQSRADT